MTKPDFVYVTYISTTPEKVWQALIDTDITRQYWIDPTTADPGHVNVSDWKPGSRWEHQRMDESRKVDIAGKVVESDPPRRLVLSWARPEEFADDTKHSRVTFEIEQQGSVVRLMVTHEDLAKDEKMAKGVSSGWPKILSNLKTMLETGSALPGSIK
jgi:uncharacterized protein YndB with AHSA1/START domain